MGKRSSSTRQEVPTGAPSLTPSAPPAKRLWALRLGPELHGVSRWSRAAGPAQTVPEAPPTPVCVCVGGRGGYLSRSAPLWTTGLSTDAGVLGGGRGPGGPVSSKPSALSPVPSVPSDAAEQPTGAVGTDPRPVPARVPRRAGRGVPLQTREPGRERVCGGPGQILLCAAALHQPHHQAEVGGLGGTGAISFPLSRGRTLSGLTRLPVRFVQGTEYFPAVATAENPDAQIQVLWEVWLASPPTYPFVLFVLEQLGDSVDDGMGKYAVKGVNSTPRKGLQGKQRAGCPGKTTTKTKEEIDGWAANDAARQCHRHREKEMTVFRKRQVVLFFFLTARFFFSSSLRPLLENPVSEQP